MNSPQRRNRNEIPATAVPVVDEWRRAFFKLHVWSAVLVVLAGVAALVTADSIESVSLRELVNRFNLDSENSVPAWFSSINLILCAQALFAIFFIERRRGERRYWLGMSLVFVLLSMDEAASFHEALMVPLRRILNVDGIFFFAWVIPGSAAVLVFVAALWGFLSRLPRKTAWAFVRAGAIFCLGAIGIEMLGSLRYSENAYEADFGFGLLVLVEESLELAGEILFLRELLAYLAGRTNPYAIAAVKARASESEAGALPE